MEIRVLKYFLKVIEVGNITKAANALHITQPTLSRQLMQLEEEVGASLFIRGKHEIQLSEEGMILKRRAEEIMVLQQKALDEINTYKQEVSGEIIIGCGITEATQTMATWIKEFTAMYPKVTFVVKNGNSDFILENIHHGILDFGFLLSPVKLDKLNSILLNNTERWVILMRQNDPLASKQYIEAKDLILVPFINTLRKEPQQFFMRWFGMDASLLDIKASAELTTTASILVKNGLGYALIVEGSVKEASGENLCTRTLMPPLESKSYFVWKKEETYSIPVSKFIAFVQEKLES